MINADNIMNIGWQENYELGQQPFQFLQNLLILYKRIAPHLMFYLLFSIIINNLRNMSNTFIFNNNLVSTWISSFLESNSDTISLVLLSELVTDIKSRFEAIVCASGGIREFMKCSMGSRRSSFGVSAPNGFFFRSWARL